MKFFRFGEESVEKIIDWTLRYVPVHTSPCILEVGCGNGTLLFALFQSGYAPERMLGIDYSSDALKLAKSIASSRGIPQITFNVCDFLEGDPPLLSVMDYPSTNDAWDLILDKGTYDAISLGERDASGRSPAAKYPERIARLLQAGGHFLITCGFSHMLC